MSTIVTIPPSGNISRVKQDMELIATYPANTNIVNLMKHDINVHTNEEGLIELYKPTYGEVMDLPEPQENTVYVVSGMVNSATPNRSDVVSPGDHVRDENGRPIGCIGFRN